MGPGAPTLYCKRCDTWIREQSGRCPHCDTPATLPPAAHESLRLSPAEWAALPAIDERPVANQWVQVTPTGAPPAQPSKPPADTAAALEPASEQQPAAIAAVSIEAAQPETCVAAADQTPAGAPTPADPAPVAASVPAPLPPLATEDDTLDDDTDDPPSAVTLRPPVLASNVLQAQLYPLEPGRVSIRWITCALGLVGTTGALWELGLSPAGVPICCGFAVLTALGLVPMTYLARAAALLLFATLGIAATNLFHHPRHDDGSAISLLGTVIVLGLGLHFRAWHRASILARVFVALGLASATCWLCTYGSVQDLSVLQGDWRSWGPPIFELPLVILLMLALLAFMDARTTGGCGAWAMGLWCWYGSYLALSMITEAWAPTCSLGEALNHLRSNMVVPLAHALFAPLWAMSTAQLIAGIRAVGKANQASSPPFPNPSAEATPGLES